MEPSLHQPSTVIDFETAKNNLIEMRNNPNGVFYANGNKIGSVSKFNLLGRLIHYLKGDSSSSKVKEIINVSFNTITDKLTTLDKSSDSQETKELKKAATYTIKPGLFEFYEKSEPVSGLIESVRKISIVKKDSRLQSAVEKANIISKKIAEKFNIAPEHVY